MGDNLLISLITGLFVGVASGYLGSIMILKRLALAGDALSHVALPGLGIAIIYQINPFIGAFAALGIGVALIWWIERKTSVPSDAIVGLIFATALAMGILITPEPELLEALFGDISRVSLLDGVLAAVLSSAVVLSLSLLRKKTVLALVAPDLAKSQGIKAERLELIFLVLVAVIVALGVKVVGTLLMGALVVIPAAAAKNIARNLYSYGLIGGLLGAVSAVSGILAAGAFALPPGPLVVLASGALFLGTLFFKKAV